MDRARDRGMPVSGVVHGIVSERDVADHRVEEIVRQGRFLEPFREYRRVRIELFCDARRDAVQLDAGPPAAGQKSFRHQAEEMPDAHRGLKDLRARRQPEALPSPARAPR